MPTYQEVCDGDELYCCEKCEDKFKVREVNLVKINTDLRVLKSDYHTVLLDKDGIFKIGEKIEKGDSALACPKCNHAHLFGLVRHIPRKEGNDG